MAKLFQTKKEENEGLLYSNDNGFLQLVLAEKEGIEVARKHFDLQKNSLMHKWSQFFSIISVLNSYD